MTAYSLALLPGLGTVRKEHLNKSANLFFTAMPGSDVSGAIILDLFGVTSDINISGTYTAADGDIPTFILALENIVNGQQESTTYISGKSGKSYTVYIDSIDWDSEEGNVSAVNYDIVMKQGGS